MRFPQQTVRLRQPPPSNYADSSSSSSASASASLENDASSFESPLPLGTQPRFVTLLRSSASARKLKGKEVANYGPMPPKNEKCKSKYYRRGAAQERACDHCDTAAESSGHWRPSPATTPCPSTRSQDLDEVDPVDLRGAVYSLTIFLEQEKNICLATIKLKYEKRRQRIPKWLKFSRGVLDPLEKREYDRKRRELDDRLLNEILHYEASVKARFTDRRHSAPEARPAESFLGCRRQVGIVFPNSI
ncbi:hypothetical protein PG991_003851 [Apiospora marii]|uniref:Uncharacterized protein n=1 Tax=Apiospora marii TaxID=335849 RepID=A0ABR1S4L0_9PEZI